MAAIDLVTLAEVRLELELPQADTSRNTLAEAVITQVSRAIATYTGRQWKVENNDNAGGGTTRKFRIPVGSYLLDLDPYEVHNTASLGVTINAEAANGGTELTQGDDFVAMPYGTTNRSTYTTISISREVSGLHTGAYARKFGFTEVSVHSQHWGWETVPDDVKRAAILAVAANMDRRLDAFATAQDLVDPDVGLQPLRAASFALPTSTMALLAPYRRHVGAF